MHISRGTLSLIAAAAIIYLVAVVSRSSFEDFINRSSQVDNPIYPELELAANRLGLDVSFAKSVKKGRFDARDNVLFIDVPVGGWDVIIMGDSALAWSFSATLVEQASGKRVAFLAQTNAFANKGMFDLSQKVAERYLKPGGQLVYLFSSGSWQQEAMTEQLTEDMRLLTQWAKPQTAGWSFLDVTRNIYDLAPRINNALTLPDIPFYEKYVESRVAPTRASEKRAASFGAGCAEFQWERHGGSVFYMCDRTKNRNSKAVNAKKARLMTDDEPCRSNLSAMAPIKSIEANIRELGAVPINNKIIAVPFAIDHSAMWLFRCVSKEVLNDAGVVLLDLPKKSKELFGDIEYEFEGGPHVANASSVTASYVLGKSLSRVLTPPIERSVH